MECSIFNLPFQIVIYTQVTTATVLLLQFNFVVILRWYSEKGDPRSCPGTIAVKGWAILSRHSQIWHKACSYYLDFKLLKFSTLLILIFHAGLRGLGSNNFCNSSYKENTVGSALVSRLSFRFLWLCQDWELTNWHSVLVFSVHKFKRPPYLSTF